MFKLIADTSFNWEYYRDENGFAYVSPSCLRLTGYAPGEFMSDPGLLEEIVHPSHREAFREQLCRASLTGEPERLRLVLTCRDGSECWVEHLARQVRDAQGARRGLRGSVRDITSFRNDEERRKAYESGYRVLAEQQAEVVCCWLPDTTLTFVNEAYCRLTGRSPGELLGRRWLSLVPADARENVRTHYETLAAEPRVNLYEHEVTGADGRTLWMQWIDAPVLDDRGGLVEFQSIGRDLTEHRRALTALQDSEERFRAFMSQLPAMALIKDEQSRVLFTNRTLNEVMGTQDWIGRDALKNLPAGVAAKIMEDDRRVLEGGRPVVIEEAIPDRSGETRIFETRKFPIGREGKPPLLGAIVLDVTESRERAQRLEEANIAMKVLLRHRDEDRREIEQQFLENFRKLIVPSLEKLRKSGLTPRQGAYVDVVEMNVSKVFSASGEAGLAQAALTPIEMRIVGFIKEDRTTKEIGSLLNLSPRTVEYYRDRIRKKLGLKSKNVNLRSYLYSLS